PPGAGRRAGGGDRWHPRGGDRPGGGGGAEEDGQAGRAHQRPRGVEDEPPGPPPQEAQGAAGQGSGRAGHGDRAQPVSGPPAAGGLGLAVALLAVALWEVLARRVQSVDEVARALGVRLVGTLPAVPARGRDRAVLPDGPPAGPWQTHLTESVDSYRTMLLHEA